MKRLQRKKNRIRVGKGKKKKNKINKNRTSIFSKNSNENADKNTVISTLPDSNIKNSSKQKKYNNITQHVENNRLGLTKRVANLFNRGLVYLKESKLEISRVVWPSRKQVFGSTCVVLFVVCFFSIFFGVVDFILSTLHQLILRQ